LQRLALSPLQDHSEILQPLIFYASYLDEDFIGRWDIYSGPSFQAPVKYTFWFRYTEATGLYFSLASSTVTQIHSVVPSADEVVATSTALIVGATGYIHADDYEDAYVQIKVWNQGAGASAVSPAVVTSTYNFPISSSGVFDVSTTTNATTAGMYNLVVRIMRSQTWWQDEELDKSATKFTASTTIGWDLVLNNPLNVFPLGNELANLATSSLADGGVCDWDWTTNFQLGKCVRGLIATLLIPDNAMLIETTNDFKGTFLRKAPWGYATRVWEIMSASTTPAVLPSISAVIPEGLPHAGDSFDFTPWDSIEATITRVDTASVASIDGSPFDTFMFWFNTVAYILFGLWLIKEVRKVAHFV